MENIDFIEDCEKLSKPVLNTYTDDELSKSGLVKVNAFVRTKQSKNALRVKKSKEKKAEQGFKQLNVVVPEAYRDSFKVLAKRLCDGDVDNHLFAIVTSENVKQKQRFQSMYRKRNIFSSWILSFVFDIK